MATTRQPTLREQVEDFLFREAALLDDWRLDDWVALFTEDARYVVPTTDLPDGDPQRRTWCSSTTTSTACAPAPCG